MCECTNGIRFPVHASYLTWSHGRGAIFGPGVSKEIGDRSAVQQSVVAHRLDSATSDR